MLAEGTHVGRYIVESLLGSGGMSSVYRARHRSLNSRHALKVLSEAWTKDAELRERFLNEGQVLAQVQHPALVRVTDVVDDGTQAALGHGPAARRGSRTSAS